MAVTLREGATSTTSSSHPNLEVTIYDEPFTSFPIVYFFTPLEPESGYTEEVTPLRTVIEEALDIVNAVQGFREMLCEWLGIHDEFNEQYRDQIQLGRDQTDVDGDVSPRNENFYRQGAVPQWMERLPPAFEEFYICYAKNNSSRAVDDMLAFHT